MHRSISRLALVSFIIGSCIALPAQEAKKDDAQESKAPPQTGEFTHEIDGVTAALWAECLTMYGGQVKPEAAQKIRNGETKQIAAETGKKVTFAVYVPKDYQPDVPHGLLVFINSGDGGKAKGDWKPVLDKHRMIYIGANDSGNEKGTDWRHSLALEGLLQMREMYNIDPDRQYICGNSGGGRVCSQVMVMHGHVFNGGFPLIGCNPYRNLALGGGSFMPAMIKIKDPKVFNHCRQNNRYVFLTGDKDFNRDQVKQVYELYGKDGFRHLTYLQVPGMGHKSPDGEWFEKGIVALDAPLKAAAAENYKLATKSLERKQQGPALDAFRSAAFHAPEADFAADAKKQYTELRAKYDADVAAIEELVAAGDRSGSLKLLAVFRRTWSTAGKQDAERLTAAARDAKRPTKSK